MNNERHEWVSSQGHHGRPAQLQLDVESTANYHSWLPFSLPGLEQKRPTNRGSSRGTPANPSSAAALVGTSARPNELYIAVFGPRSNHAACPGYVAALFAPIYVPVIAVENDETFPSLQADDGWNSALAL